MAEPNILTSDTLFFCFDCQRRVSPISHNTNVYECPQCHGRTVAKVNGCGRPDLASLGSGLNDRELRAYHLRQRSLDRAIQITFDKIRKCQESLREHDRRGLGSGPTRQMLLDQQRLAEERVALAPRQRIRIDQLLVQTYIRNMARQGESRNQGEISSSENFVTQRLNQIQISGAAPPLSKEKIEAIPSTEVSETMRNKIRQCSVCLDDFTVGERVRLFICDHFFHDQCIVPWVQQHATCPICRKDLASDQAAPNDLEETGPDNEGTRRGGY